MYQALILSAHKKSKTVAIALIKGYRFLLSPWLGNQCRFYPSCSHYAEAAIEHYGLVKGILLGAWRILRCNPFHHGGYDPIPCEKLLNKERA